MSRYAGPNDFAQHRDRICNLYRAHSLQQVISIMRESKDFHGTRRQFRYYLSRWGQDKKHKEPEMIAIVVLQRQRKSRGLESEFYIRDKRIQYEEVLHYWRRRPDRSIETLTLDGPVPDTIRCITPVQSFSRSDVASTISDPKTIRQPAEALSSLKDLIRGSFDNKTWSSTDDTLYPVNYYSTDAQSQARHGLLMDTLHKKLRLACDLYSMSQNRDAFRCLQEACAAIKELTKVCYPPIFDRLPRTLIGLAVEKGRIEIVPIVLRLFEGMAKLYHSDNHPFSKFFALLTSMQDDVLINVIYASIALVDSEFTKILGRFHRTTLASRYTYIRTVVAEQGWEAEAESCRQLVRQCERYIGRGDPRTLKAGSDLALVLKRSGQFKEAKQEAEKIIQSTCDAVVDQNGLIQIRDPRAAKIYARGHSILGHCEYGLGSSWTASAIRRKEHAKKIFQSLGPDSCGLISEEDFYLAQWRKHGSSSGSIIIVDYQERDQQYGRGRISSDTPYAAH